MSSSEEDSEYEPSLRNLNTSDDTASSSDNEYFLTSEEEEEGDNRSIKKAGETVSSLRAKRTTRTRDSAMDKMESLVEMWYVAG
ncbi:hypothetical protein E2C01_055364 [Portunus trituberculatus]|uniref:Uncharacterized protein n=1 Tax=Portunus trituberculatus TaxID=210409 RepID=A0A5B7GV31_PORTR|nr:hypothetical protein [Portunus trituberculatus]